MAGDDQKYDWMTRLITPSQALVEVSIFLHRSLLRRHLWMRINPNTIYRMHHVPVGVGKAVGNMLIGSIDGPRVFLGLFDVSTLSLAGSREEESRHDE